MPYELPFTTRLKPSLRAQFRPEIFGAHSAQGKRARQEDDYVLAHAPSASGHSLIGIFDGMGGMENGHLASQAAADTFAQAAPEILKCKSGLHRRFALQLTLREAGEKVENAAGKNSGTTATVFQLHNGVASGIHIGDSRAYKYEPAAGKGKPRLMQLTEDHRKEWFDQVGGSFLHHSDLTEALTGRLVGKQQHVKPTKIGKGGALVLCTDGVWEKVSAEKMVKILSTRHLTAQEMARQLVHEALDRGSHDNCTALVYLNRRVGRVKRSALREQKRIGEIRRQLGKP